MSWKILRKILAVERERERAENLEDTQENPCAVIRVKDVKIIPFSQISWELAQQDGEDENLEAWQEKERDFFEEEADLCGFDFDEEMPVVCEIFELVYKKN